MADICVDLETYLASIGAVTTLVGAGAAARIFNDVPRDRAALPFIVLQEVGGQSMEILTGAAGLAESIFHIYAYAGSRAAADSLAETIRTAPMQGFRGDMGATANVAVTHDDFRLTGIDLTKDKSGGPHRRWTRGTYQLFYDQ